MKTFATPLARTLATMGVVGAMLLSPHTAQAARSMGNDSADTVTTADLVATFERTSPGFTGIATSGLPTRLDGTFQMGDVTVHLGHSDTGTRHAGYVNYGSTTLGHEVVAASDGRGTERFALILQSEDEPRQRLRVTLPTGAQVRNTPTGAVVVKTEHGTTRLNPASAVDSTGQVLPARYRLIGKHLVIDVDLKNARGPVMVDPSVSAAYWWGTTRWYSISYVRAHASTYSVLNQVKWTICNRLGAAAGTCRWVADRYVGWITGGWATARRNGQCLKVSMTWTGWVREVTPYRCNWW